MLPKIPHEAETVSSKDGEQLVIMQGWSEELAAELVEKTGQSHVKTWLEDDEINFSSVNRANRWYEKDAGLPIILSLGTAAMEIAGVAWITNVGIVNKKDGHVFGVRIYDGYREQGLANDLGRRVHQLFDKDRRARTRFKAHVANQAAFTVGLNLGYRLEEGPSHRQLNMVRKPPSLL